VRLRVQDFGYHDAVKPSPFGVYVVHFVTEHGQLVTQFCRTKAGVHPIA
jgi:hypothetical protein